MTFTFVCDSSAGSIVRPILICGLGNLKIRSALPKPIHEKMAAVKQLEELNQKRTFLRYQASEAVLTAKNLIAEIKENLGKVHPVCLHESF